MHDPKSVAFEIPYPWRDRSCNRKLWPKGRRRAFITVWRVDPNCRGDDGSSSDRRILLRDREDCREAGGQARRGWKLSISIPLACKGWELQCHPLRRFRRWAFSRCAGCGGRFPWGYAPISRSWDGDGPRWFRGEPGVYHHECSNVHAGTPAGPVPA